MAIYKRKLYIKNKKKEEEESRRTGEGGEKNRKKTKNKVNLTINRLRQKVKQKGLYNSGHVQSTSAKYERSSQMFMIMSLGGKHIRVYSTLLLGLVQSVNCVTLQVNAKGEF